jgi:integrase
MATITKRVTQSGVKFTAQVRRKGVSESKTFSNAARAKLWAAQREAELSDIAEGVIPKHTLGEAFDRYAKEVSPGKRGGRWEVIRLRALPDTGGRLLRTSVPLQSVSPALLGEWRDQRMTEVQAGTVLRELSVLSAVFQRCVREWGWLRENPVKGISKPASPAHRDKVLTRSEVRRVIAELRRSGDKNSKSYRVALAFLFALRTGMRAGEICGIQPEHVHDDSVTLPLTKNKTRRDVPLSRKAKIILQRVIKSNQNPVFGLTTGSLDALFRKARDRAGVVNVHFHDSRHWAATNMARKLPLVDLCRMFGWKDPKHALIYYNATATSIAALLDK